ncbi:MAG: tRNA uridine-5-carboxymethylaminomethyl(34) synthesis enzyme MnmG [Desulfarculales bacterium]|jgi:tRNA uridine 5-carboxymethylaminomethyl modification enzyme|nr:tRNA uridine-5-carboxymethylaminomethyl(34) synthesis enzyme MnmG [Desulfarculales bacterium]
MCSLSAPEDKFSVIVAGGGHAGCEAALASARMGASTLLISLSPLASLSCNPAIGGLAKGHLVKEIDALGGAMAQIADRACLQFRLLNQTKGPAVWSSRAQVDIDLYPEYMRSLCDETVNLTVLSAEVSALWLEGKKLKGVIVNDRQKISASAVILTSGTFLNGLIHVGLQQTAGGRWLETPSLKLAEQLHRLNFNIRRLKTGTPPRLLSSSLNLSILDIQAGDPNPRMFSFQPKPPELPQTACYLTRTTELTHSLVRKNLDKSPMYTGIIKAAGARYCPSLEDKVVKFERESHQVFLEPQGLNSPLIYPNGISTSLPLSVQEQLVRSLPGCENAVIVRPGYAIEYDMLNPLDLTPWLESQIIEGLFMAGQINGTSGYEEAAAQGLAAGISAARKVRGDTPYIFERSQSYIGVLIDDLVTRGTNEPYRMFTSRSEYRLSLREDNADLRLTPVGYELGLLDRAAWNYFTQKRHMIDQTWQRLENINFKPNHIFNQKLGDLGQAPLKQPQNAAQLLGRPSLSLSDLARLEPGLSDIVNLPPAITEQIWIKAHYAGYLTREAKQAQQTVNHEQTAIPPDMDFILPGLSREICEKLDRIRPVNLGQAGRISGMTPAALNILSVYLHKRAVDK